MWFVHGASSLRTLALDEIERHVRNFIAYAQMHPFETFELTPIGCGLAGYSPDDIAPMFKGAPANVKMPPEFAPTLKQLAGE